MNDEIVVKFKLLPWQVKARELRTRRQLVVVNTGIHTGKTVWGATELLDDMLKHPNESFWWIAGLKFHLDAWWDTFSILVRRVGGVVRTHPYYWARLPNGARVYGVSAENVDAIASHHPMAIYGDEVAKWRQEAWHLVRARLLRQGGQPGAVPVLPEAQLLAGPGPVGQGGAGWPLGPYRMHHIRGGAIGG